MYKYSEERPKIFTEEGIKCILDIYANIMLTEPLSHGRIILTTEAMTLGAGCDSWLKLACVDFLEEIGVCVKIAEGKMTQYNTYSIDRGYLFMRNRNLRPGGAA